MVFFRNFHGRIGGAQKYCDLYLVFLTLDFCEQVLPFPDFGDRKTQLDFRDQGGDGSTSVFQETARPILVISRLSQSKWRRPDFRDRDGDWETFPTKVETVRFSRPRRRRRDSPNPGHESLVLPKFGLKSLDRHFPNVRATLCLNFSDQILVCPDFRDQILVCRVYGDPQVDSWQSFQIQTAATWV